MKNETARQEVSLPLVTIPHITAVSELTGNPLLLGRLEGPFWRVLFLRETGPSHLIDKNRMALGGRTHRGTPQASLGKERYVLLLSY